MEQSEPFKERLSFLDGKITAIKKTDKYIYEIFIDDNKITELSMEMYPVEPDEDTIFTALKEVGIYPELL